MNGSTAIATHIHAPYRQLKPTGSAASLSSQAAPAPPALNFEEGVTLAACTTLTSADLRPL